MQQLISQLTAVYPALNFVPGATFSWSPTTQQIIYKKVAQNPEIAQWSLLHEAGHALLGHTNYHSDLELLLMEVAAWQRAEALAEAFGMIIDSDHIQDCLDTYRDWLYQRSTCPACTVCSLQIDSRTYQCANCGTVWHVSASRMCRPYRRRARLSS